MASILNADDGVVSGSAGLKSTADSSGVLALQTNGTTAVTVTAAGSVGVGTVSPSYKLDVAGQFSRIGQSGGAGAGLIFAGASATKNWVIASQYNLSGTLEFTQTTAVGGSGISSTPSMVINESGNVGIGTSSPTAKLEVVGNIYAQSGVFLAERGTAAAPGYAFFDDSNTGMFNVANTDLCFSTQSGERMRIDSSGNVGIGTSAPNAPLDVRGNTGTSVSAVMRIRGTNTTARTTRLQFEDYAGTVADGLIDFKIPTAGSAASALFQLGINGPTITMDVNSNVGIGTSSGDIFSNGFARSLGVFSSGVGTTTAINVSGGAASRIQFGVGSTRYGLIYQDDTNFMQIATTTALPISFVTNNTERARINSDGGLLVGSTSTSGSVGNYGLVLGGIFRSFSGTTASTASGTYVTLFTASGGTISSYLVTVWISADDVNNYQANVIVNTQAGSSTKVSVIVAGSLLQFQMSGYDFQARQNSGGASTISWSAIRILG